MIKVCTAFKRRQGLSVEQYQSYWAGEHPAFVRRLPGLRGYSQNRPLAEGFALRTRPGYDGLVELWFDDSAALKEMAQSPEYQELNRDEEKFADRSTLDIVFTDERVVKEGARPEGGVKRIGFHRIGRELEPEPFQQRIAEEYAALCDARPDIRRGVLSLPRLNGYGGGRTPAWDVIEMAWFDDIAAAKEYRYPESFLELTARDAAEPLYCDEVRIVRPDGSGS